MSYQSSHFSNERLKQGPSEVCSGELTGNLVLQASATTGVYREREVRLHAWIFPNILCSLLPFLPPPSLLLPYPTMEFHFFPMFHSLLLLVILHPIPNLGIFSSSSFLKAVLKVLF